MKFNDALSGAALLALAIAILVNLQGFPKIPGQNIGPGAFCITPGGWLRSGPRLRSFLVTVGCLLFYIFASERLGFIFSAIGVLGAMFLTLGVRPRLILPIAVVTTLVIHTLFYKGLRVPLPWGVLMPLAW
ncbi:MAG: tripartite tricarboxylate transporter TctB family protein [Burkholderiales bacterium]|nr:tripartite tricarboxylate transporter TctB family protein [Burkholderiales bacterium]